MEETLSTTTAASTTFKEDIILECRFYEDELPNENDLVVVQVKRVEENGAYVSLLEYGNKEGLVSPQEYSKISNMKSLHKVMRVGKIEIVKVICVDKRQGYLDLSKKQVSNEEIQQCEERYAKSKLVNSIMRNVADKMQINLPVLYEKVVWKLEKKYKDVLDAFRLFLLEKVEIFDGINLEQFLKDKLISEIKKRLTPQALRIRADFEITCFGYEGIDAIKEAIKSGVQQAQKLSNLKLVFQVISAPLYWVEVVCVDKAKGVEVINEAFKVIESVILAKQGTFAVKVQPHILGEKGDKDIQDLLKKIDKNAYQNLSEEEDNDEGMDAELEGGFSYFNIQIICLVNTEEIDNLQKQQNDNDSEDDA